MKNANNYLSATIIFFALLNASCTQVDHPGDGVVLEGKVLAEPFFGPPNYGENPETDQREVAYILHLLRPITVVESRGVLKAVTEVQVIGCIHRPINRQVFVAGQLDQGISGHHRRDFILFCGK